MQKAISSTEMLTATLLGEFDLGQGVKRAVQWVDAVEKVPNCPAQFSRFEKI